MAIIGDDYTTGDGLTLSVSLVLLEIPNEAWIKQVLISAFNTLTIDENWNDDYGDITTDEATRIMSLMLQTLQFDYEPPSMIPAGATMIWHTNAPPTGWLLCDGGAVLKADYPELYAVLGDKYGSTSTQFGLPDMSDVSPMGVGGIVGLDGFAGEQSHTLITSEIPSHSHTILLRGSGTAGGTNNRINAPTQTTLASNIVTDATGGGASHNNLHPVFGVNFIIFGGD